ncbi:MAG: hypothetical protein J6W75_09925 [Bacteroidaceae bacterium]|nr:hypothetical protein [Bacteroidaceae bacterium]
MALLLPLAAMAQHWQGPSNPERLYPTSTPLNVQVNINGELATANSGLELAAFIGEECRVSVNTTEPVVVAEGTIGTEYFVLRVWGDDGTNGKESEVGKEITIRAFYDNIEYEFKTKATFTGEAQQLTLNLDAVMDVTLPETITINQAASAFPYTEDLAQYITLSYSTPDRAYEPLGESFIISPVNYEWNVNYTNELSFNGTKLTVTPAEEANYGVILYVTYGDPKGVNRQFVPISTTISVTITAVTVTSITCDLDKTDFYAFDDFASFMADHITILPEDASNKGYSLECEGDVLTNGRFTEGGKYTVNIVPADKSYEGEPASIEVTVYVRPLTIAPTNQTIEVNYGSNVYEAIAANQTLQWPTRTDPGAYGKSEVTYDFGETGYVDADGKAIKIGSVRVTVALKDGITPSAAMQGQSSYTVSVNIVSALSVTAKASGITDFKKGIQSSDTPAYVYVTNPANEPFDPADLQIAFENRFEALPYAKQIEVVQENAEGSATSGQKVYVFHILPLYIGTPSFMVTYQGQELCGGQITISKEEALSAGWTWLSLVTPGGAVNDLFTQSDIVEIRSQQELLWNDPVYGYVGKIKALNSDEGMYKVKTNKAITVKWSGDAVMSPNKPTQGSSKTIYPGYNWVNYPYEFDITVDRIRDMFGPDFQFAEGDLIKTQESFATFDGRDWKADETFALKEGKGLLYFSNGVEETILNFSPYLEPVVNDAEGETNGDAAGRQIARRAVADMFQYDVHAFADNMSMVAEIQGLDNPEDYTLGAFVNDECRGRGRVVVDGKMFVSAVGTSGESVTFKLVNNNTGEMMPVDGTVSFSLVKGSLRAPVKLNVGAATGINKVDAARQSSEAYDLSGRRINGSQRGISIERMADGSFRKIVKK